MGTRWTLCFWFCIEFLLTPLLLWNVIVIVLDPRGPPGTATGHRSQGHNQVFIVYNTVQYGTALNSGNTPVIIHLWCFAVHYSIKVVLKTTQRKNVMKHDHTYLPLHHHEARKERTVFECQPWPRCWGWRSKHILELFWRMQISTEYEGNQHTCIQKCFIHANIINNKVGLVGYSWHLKF